MKELDITYVLNKHKIHAYMCISTYNVKIENLTDRIFPNLKTYINMASIKEDFVKDWP